MGDLSLPAAVSPYLRAVAEGGEESDLPPQRLLGSLRGEVAYPTALSHCPQWMKVGGREDLSPPSNPSARWDPEGGRSPSLLPGIPGTGSAQARVLACPGTQASADPGPRMPRTPFAALQKGFRVSSPGNTSSGAILHHLCWQRGNPGCINVLLIMQGLKIFARYPKYSQSGSLVHQGTTVFLQ